MKHLLVPASSGRSRCRGCNQPIARGELRFGESLPNPFGEGERTLWFHPRCAAYKRPAPLLELLEEQGLDFTEREELVRVARGSLAHRRLPRIDGAERAPSGQARCRSCAQPIARGAWRVRLVFYEEGLFSPGGFVHLECAGTYFGTDAILEHVLHFSRGLGLAEREEVERVLTKA